MARLSPFVAFSLVLAFQAWLCPFWSVFALSDTLYNLTICEKDVICVQSSNCQHDFQEILQKLFDFIVWGEVPCQISYIQRSQYLQEAKLQPTVKVVVYESEADNSGKNRYSNPVQTQETVYKMSRSRRNEASFKAKAERRTTKNKTKRKKQIVSIDPCYKLFKIVYILIRQDAPLKKSTLIFQMTFQTF